MSVSPLELMRYHDGELSPERAREVERVLEHDEAARERLLALGQLGDATRVWAEERSAAERDLVDGVMARIAEDDRSRTLASRCAFRRTAPVAASLIAAAAVVALFVVREHPGAPAGEAQAPAAPSLARRILVTEKAEPASVARPEPAVLSPAVAIEAVDFGESHGSIFVVSSERGDTPVVWLSDGRAISTPRNHPL